MQRKLTFARLTFALFVWRRLQLKSNPFVGVFSCAAVAVLFVAATAVAAAAAISVQTECQLVRLSYAFTS